MFDGNANFETLVEDGLKKSGVQLDPLIAEFLPQILERVHLQDNDMGRPITRDWYEGQSHGAIFDQKNSAEQTGDACLVLVSFMPRRARLLEMKRHHYVYLGVSAYYSVARMTNNPGQGDLYRLASESFVPMVHVLQAGSARTV